jgi:hypothetical protein
LAGADIDWGKAAVSVLANNVAYSKGICPQPQESEQIHQYMEDKGGSGREG